MTPRITVNLDDIPDFVSVDAGRHRAKLIEVIKEDSSKGNPMLTWNWEVTEGDNEGRTIKSYTSLLEHALGGLKMHLKAFGFAEGEVDVDTIKLHGKIALLVVAIIKRRSRETGEEFDLSTVSNVLPADAKVSRGSARSRASKAIVTSETEPGPEDDIPF